MGKTSIKIIDDSKPKDEVKDKPHKKINPSPEELEAEKRAKKVNPNPELEERKTKKVNLDIKTRVAMDDSEDKSKSKDKGKSESSKTKQGRKERSKKYTESEEKIDRGKLYPIDEATEAVKEISYSKFDGTLEIHINTAVKNVRGLVSLPFASGKKLKILAFGPSATLRMEKIEGVIWGDDQNLEEIEKGKINFDVLVTTPEWMAKLANVAKVLGPKGLMPNPKNGTITSELKKTIEEVQGGKVEYKSEPRANVIHLGIGKISQPKEELSQNIKVLLSAIGKTKIKKAVISPTMGPAIRLDITSI